MLFIDFNEYDKEEESEKNSKSLILENISVAQNSTGLLHCSQLIHGNDQNQEIITSEELKELDENMKYICQFVMDNLEKAERLNERLIMCHGMNLFVPNIEMNDSNI